MKSEPSETIRQTIRSRYGEIARTASSGCGCSPTTSCCGAADVSADTISNVLGYSRKDLASVPEGANLGLGCGNPQAIASLKPGETVLDLGSGAFPALTSSRSDEAEKLRRLLEEDTGMWPEPRGVAASHATGCAIE